MDLVRPDGVPVEIPHRLDGEGLAREKELLRFYKGVIAFY